MNAISRGVGNLKATGEDLLMVAGMTAIVWVPALLVVLLVAVLILLAIVVL